MADEGFKREFLEAHNKYRAKHNSMKMTLKDDLNASAQSWADHLLSIRTLVHSETKNGENIYYQWSSASLTLTGKEAVDSWYNEIKSYDFGNPGFASGTGHFTQVVWNNSTELGVGVATDGNYVFVVGQYRPAGNVMGQFQKNVPPAGDGASVNDNKPNNDDNKPNNDDNKPNSDDNSKPCTLL